MDIDEYTIANIKEESELIINYDPDDLFIETHEIFSKCESCSSFYDPSAIDKTKEFIDFSPILICEDCQTYFNDVKTNFVCVGCNNVYGQQQQLENHQKCWTSVSSVSTEIKCPECFQPLCTTKANDNPKHFQFCHKSVKRAYICYICNGLFDNIESLKIHTRNHFKCDVCFQVFKTMQLREKHAKTHKYAIPVTSLCYVCKFCNALFGDLKSLKIHTKIHFKCNLCLQAFSSSSLLDKHKCPHAKQITFNCTICNVCFPTIILLKRHAIGHTLGHTARIEKNGINCSICSSEFDNEEDLNRHKVIHKTIKTYSRKKLINN